MKFAMYGSGAAGSVFASYLRKGGADIILIDRYEAHMKKVAEEGMHFTIHQEEDGGYKDYDYQLKGFRTYTTAADAAAAEGKVDVIYLCSPNNPTGTVLSADQLKVWVDYANANGSIIMFDAAYERFIVEEGVPHSIYEVEGAKTCAIEFRSFSKTAGFTGARCGYTVVPKGLVRDGQSLNAMWNRRQCTKFNGASYIIQRGAAAIYTEEGERQIEETLAYYRNNARVIKEGLEAAGFTAVSYTHLRAHET